MPLKPLRRAQGLLSPAGRSSTRDPARPQLAPGPVRAMAILVLMSLRLVLDPLLKQPRALGCTGAMEPGFRLHLSNFDFEWAAAPSAGCRQNICWDSPAVPASRAGREITQHLGCMVLDSEVEMVS